MGLREAIILGSLTGSRSMAPLAFVLHSDIAAEESSLPFNLIPLGTLKRLVPVLAAGELIADKTSVVPNRNATFPLLGRAVNGGMIGWIVMPKARLVGAAAGALAAIIAANLSYSLRKSLVEKRNLPDFVVALVEDVIVITVAKRTTDASILE